MSPSDPHDGGQFPRMERAYTWAVAGVLPGLLACYGVSCILRQQAWMFIGRRHGDWSGDVIGIFELVWLGRFEGVAAMAIGGVYVALALFAHAHWFPAAGPRHRASAELLKLAAVAYLAVAVAAGCVWLLWMVFAR